MDGWLRVVLLMTAAYLFADYMRPKPPTTRKNP